MDATFSVVIPAYNAARHIENALKSVLRQDTAPHQVVVIDDGSADGTAQLATSVSRDISVVSTPNSGVSAARNFGFQLCTGSHVAWLDADDEWVPSKLSRFRTAFAEHPDAAFAFSDYRTIGDDDQHVRLSATFERWKRSGLLLVPTVTVLPSAAVVRRHSEMRFPEWATQNEDSIYFNELAREGTVQHIPEALTIYRRHAGSAQAQATSREKGCDALWTYYGNHPSVALRTALRETFADLTLSRLDANQGEAFAFFSQYLRRRLPLSEQPFYIRHSALAWHLRHFRRAYRKAARLILASGRSTQNPRGDVEAL